MEKVKICPIASALIGHGHAVSKEICERCEKDPSVARHIAELTLLACIESPKLSLKKYGRNALEVCGERRVKESLLVSIGEGRPMAEVIEEVEVLGLSEEEV